MVYLFLVFPLCVFLLRRNMYVVCRLASWLGKLTGLSDATLVVLFPACMFRASCLFPPSSKFLRRRWLRCLSAGHFLAPGCIFVAMLLFWIIFGSWIGVSCSPDLSFMCICVLFLFLFLDSISPSGRAHGCFRCDSIWSYILIQRGFRYALKSN